MNDTDSDSDGEINESREFLKECETPILDHPSQKDQSLLPPSSMEPHFLPPRRAHKPLLKNVATIQRSHSEPKLGVSTVKATDSGAAEGSLESTRRRSGSSIKDQRSVSNPTSATLVLTNSTGIASMLSRKRKGESLKKGATKKVTGKKEKPLKLAPEKSRIFNGLRFYFLPNDDISGLRRARITKARERGAIWVRDLNEPITHLIVDDGLTRKDVVTYLKILPEGASMVNMEWLLDCIEQKFPYDPHEKKYQIKDPDGIIENDQIQDMSQQSEQSLQLKAPTKPKNWEYIPPKETPERSQHSLTTTHPVAVQLASKFAQQSQQQDSNNLTENSSQLPNKDSPPDPKQKDFGILNEAIELAKATEGVLDHDNSDDDLTSTFSEADDVMMDSDSEDGRRSPLKAPTKTHRTAPAGKGSLGKFQCMTGGTASKGPNPNDRTIEILSRMREYYERIGDQWRSRSYLLACGQLKNQPTLIRTFEDAITIPKIGQRIAKKIEEIILTGRLLRLENAEAEPDDQILKLFTGIYGVNVKIASKWISQGHRSFADLLSHIRLTPSQRIGIEHYDDLRLRIPRDEVTALGKVITDTAALLDPEIEITIGGSYRRGAKSSGDIDIIISKPNTTNTTQLTPFLSSLVKTLTDSHFLVAALAVPHNNEGSKWHGCCVLSSSSFPPTSPSPQNPPNPWRRIDLLLVPASEIGAALIYFTGDDIFNRSMRLLAGKKGMRLNQRGLYRDVMRERGSRKKVTEGTLVEGRDGRRIFEVLGVPWREPWERVLR